MASLIAKPIPNEEDSSIDIVSDEDADNHGQLSPGIKQQNQVSPLKKRLRIGHPSGEETKYGNYQSQLLYSFGKARIIKFCKLLMLTY